MPNRRQFIAQSVSGAAAIGFPAVLKAANPNSKLQVASIGANGMAFSDLSSIGSHPQVKYVAFCDVDSSRFDKADATFPGTPHFADYREMLNHLGDKVDAVNVGVPDHMHAHAAITAMSQGKHVYCQKPLAHTVWEARQMTLWAEKKGLITQMGNQIHSSVQYRLGTQLIKDGAIGKVKEVHSWVAVSGNERTRLFEPPAAGPVPANLNWDLWIGCAPMRDFAPDAYHPFVWRDWQDFGGGALGDFGCHILDPVFTALDLRYPLSVIADNSGINRQIWPTTETVRWVFPGNQYTAGDKLEITWTDGGLKPAHKLAKLPGDLELPASGSLFIGEKGNMVMPHVGPPGLYPKDQFTDYKYPTMPPVASHWHRWVDGVLSNQKTSDGFHYAGPLAETVQLGNIATRVTNHPGGSKGGHHLDGAKAKILQWDAANLSFPNAPAATSLVTKNYRDGWQVTQA
jgi:predicted dehydrogenase